MVPNNDKVQYICWGHEVGDCGTPHLQGYLKTKNTVTWSSVCKFMARCHVEKMTSSVDESVDYCHKKGKPNEVPLIQFGDKPRGSGARSDLWALHEALKGGLSKKEVSNQFFGQFLRYTRGVKDWFDLNESTTVRPEPKIYWLWGETGSGKSYRIQSHLLTSLEAGEVYCLTETTSGAWWDKYQGQETVWMDDLRGSWMKMHNMLRLLQSAPCQVSARGAGHWLAAHTFYITTNAPPVELYVDSDKLMRRVMDYGWVVQCNRDSVVVEHRPTRHDTSDSWIDSL